ncbi:MAG: hypothetical protein A3F84_04200 [Candidatus Handelsmanbacteria bacterium RIFCSPLOWO2_12_FULL_64_10]|uniref:Lipocalin-like domain-containing protein n=1 Tax=Handelsmanbacteria sp. (strain RIFCSPLOWO2_12_FULL_64_10) TaxID=1817868 RepID=A0A1F6D6T4_HANXR|nr:MAG: hypothetical protein A3F84_04200 [Candidatus Handelsmanbacteria bacterium RIFCSPLOWO2_12_FULL_64_10]
MKRTLVSTMGVVVMMALAGCGREYPTGPFTLSDSSKGQATKDASQIQGLLGAWQMQGVTGAPPKITFKGSGEVEVTESAGYAKPVTVSGAFKVEGDRLILVAREEGLKDAGMAPQMLAWFTAYSFVVDGNALILTSSDKATRWVKA